VTWRTWKGGTRHVRRVRCPTTLRRPDLVRLKIARRTVPQNLPGPKEPKTEGAEVPRVGRVGDGEQVAEGQAGRGRELVRVLAAVVDGLGQGRVVGLLTAVAVASLLVRSVGVTAT